MKKILLSVLCLFFGFALISCNRSNNYKLKSAADPIELTYNDELNNFIDKLDVFAAKLTVSLYKQSDKRTNMCISPVSIYMALAMAIECASGDTRQEMLDAVGVTYDEVLNFTGYLYSMCNKEYKTNDKIIGYQELANSIWINDNINLKEEKLDVLANKYNTDSFYVPFTNKNTLANKALSDYVKEKTHGLIDNDFNLSIDTMFALVNTLYLKDIWNRDGNDLLFTKDKYDFKEYDGNIVKTKLLSGYYNLGRVVENNVYKTFYTKTQSNITIKFILPKDEYTLDDILDVNTLTSVYSLDSYNPHDEEKNLEYHTRCYFPEFEATFKSDLKDVLINDFNIKLLFDRKLCDFTSIIDGDVYCSSVIHQAKLKVDKTGIEGAAVTIIANEGTAGPMYELVYEDFIVDKTFAYIVCNSKGVQLFTGVINNI